MSCENNILDIPLSGSVPADTDVVIMTLADGTTVIRYWALIKAQISRAQRASVTVSDGVLYNLPAQSLLKGIVYMGVDAQTIDLGTTVGGSQIASGAVTEGSYVGVNVFYLGSQTLYVSGLTGARAFLILFEV